MIHFDAVDFSERRSEEVMFLLILSVLYTPYISRGFYFRESGAIREFNNTRK